MVSRQRIQTGLTIVSFFVTLNTLFFYGFVRDGTWLVIAILLIPIYRKIGVTKFFIGSISFLTTTLILVWVVDHGLPGFFYWEPHYRMVSKDSDGFLIYQKNKDVEMIQLYGDLRRSAGSQEKFLEYEPRNIKFITDSIGFRNEHDYRGQSFVLAGDSFIAGNGVSQEHTLSSILRTNHKIDTYNLGVGGAGFADYLHNIEKLERKTKSAFKVLLFVYEGNDFVDLGPRQKPKPLSTLKKLQNIYRIPLNKYKRFLFKDTGLYQHTYNAYRSTIYRLKGEDRSLIQVREIGNHKIGFHNYHIAPLSQNSGIPEEFKTKLRSFRTRVTHMFFVPTKYRTYHSFGASKMSHTFWEATLSLGNELGIPVTDLTPALVEAAQKQLTKGRFVFRKDGSHWNEEGIKTAAQVVCEAVKEIKCAYEIVSNSSLK